MTHWSPPIPYWVLGGREALALGNAQALLGYMYNNVQRDGSVIINLHDVAAELGCSWRTAARYWSEVRASRFVAKYEQHGRDGIIATFARDAIDWRVLAPAPIAQPEAELMTLDQLMVGVAPATNHDSMLSSNDVAPATNHDSNHDSMLSCPNMYTCLSPDPTNSFANAQELVAAQSAPPVGKKRRTKGRQADLPLDDDPVSVYSRICEARPNQQQRQSISSTITDIAAWREVCERWARNGYVVQRLDRMFQAYNERVNGVVRPQPGGGVSSNRSSIASGVRDPMLRAEVQKEMQEAIERARNERLKEEAT